MRLAAILIIAAFCVACEDTHDADINRLYQNACSSPDPLVDVEWIQKLKDNLSYYDHIVQGKYLSETVFYVKTICANCSMLPPTPTLYDCSGTIIKKFNNSGRDQDELKKLTMEKVLYPERYCLENGVWVEC